METQDVDVVEEPKVTPCTVWGSDKVLTDIDEIENYRSMLKEVVIGNLLIGTIGDDGTYTLKTELKRDLMRIQKGVADESPRYYLAYATVLDKTFHFSIAIDDINDNEVVATLYLTESVQDYPYLESVRTFVASVMLPNDDLKARVYKTFNLVDTIPDNNDDKLIQNLLLRMLEIVNQAAPSSSVEQPHDAPQVEQTEIKGDKKPAAKSKAKSAAKPAKKADKKKKDNKKKNKGKDEKKKSKKLEDLLGKKYAVPTSAEKNIQIDVQPAEKTEIIVTPINKADKPVVPPKNVMPQETPKEDDKSDDNAQNLFGTGRSLFVQEFRAEVVVGEVTNERVFTENPGEEPSKSVETETFSESGNETNQQTEIFDGSQAAPTPQIITEQQ